MLNLLNAGGDNQSQALADRSPVFRSKGRRGGDFAQAVAGESHLLTADQWDALCSPLGSSTLNVHSPRGRQRWPCSWKAFCKCDSVKEPRWGDCPGLLGGPNVIMRVFKRGRQESRSREGRCVEAEVEVTGEGATAQECRCWEKLEWARKRVFP